MTDLLKWFRKPKVEIIQAELVDDLPAQRQNLVPIETIVTEGKVFGVTNEFNPNRGKLDLPYVTKLELSDYDTPYDERKEVALPFSFCEGIHDLIMRLALKNANITLTERKYAEGSAYTFQVHDGRLAGYTYSCPEMPREFNFVRTNFPFGKLEGIVTAVGITENTDYLWDHKKYPYFNTFHIKTDDGKVTEVPAKFSPAYPFSTSLLQDKLVGSRIKFERKFKEKYERDIDAEWQMIHILTGPFTSVYWQQSFTINCSFFGGFGSGGYRNPDDPPWPRRVSGITI